MPPLLKDNQHLQFLLQEAADGVRRLAVGTGQCNLGNLTHEHLPLVGRSKLRVQELCLGSPVLEKSGT